MVQDLASRCRAKTWTLLRFREARAAVPQMVTMYIARVHSTLEYCCQINGGLINDAQSKLIEEVQVRCCQIILGVRSKSYAKNLAELDLERLDERRSSLMERFAVSCYACSDHSWWFTRNERYTANTRTEFSCFIIPKMKKKAREKTLCLLSTYFEPSQ